MNYEAGEIVILNEEEYVIVSVLDCNQITYLYLTTMTKPIKVVLAKKIDDYTIEPLSSEEETQYLLARFNSVS